MDDCVEISSDSDSNDDEVNCSQAQFDVNHNNNGSFSEIEVLTTQKVYDMMQREVQKVRDVSDISASKARSLLAKYKWDSAKLLEEIFENNDKTRELMKDSWKVARYDIRKIFDCEICFESVGYLGIVTFPCKHHFCKDCLLGYVTSMIMETGGILNSAIKCPGHKCAFELDDDFVLATIGDSEMKLRYQQIIANSFVQNNRSMKWCPSPKCQSAVLLEPGFVAQLHESVRCKCAFWFCFHCQSISHDPVPCKMLNVWAKIKAEDMEARSWILKNTKPCPACNVNIEKNAGCMHMTCSKCKHQFCWVCMGLWSRSHNCGRPKLVATTEQAITSVRRFVEYNAKHETMKQAYNFDLRHYGPKLESGLELELDKQWVKIDFVANAVEILLLCRRTLMHSYIFSFLMTTLDNQMYIFEENLKYLERCTEALSGILETQVIAANVFKMKERIIDTASLCTKRRRDLIDHVIEGYDNEWWRKFPIPPEELIAANDEAVERLLY